MGVLLPLLGSVAAVAALVAMAFAMGFGRAPSPLDADLARREAEAALTGFVAQSVLVSTDGRAALLSGRDGSRALVFALGDRFVVRRLGTHARVEPQPGGLLVRCGEPGIRPVMMALDAPAPGWTLAPDHGA
jgi:hypothetical protein